MRAESFQAFWVTKAGETLDQVATRDSSRGEVKINVDAQLRVGGSITVHNIPSWVDPLKHWVRVEGVLDDVPISLGAFMLKEDQVAYAGKDTITDLTLVDPIQAVYNAKPSAPLVLPEGANVVDWVRGGLESIGVELLNVTASDVEATSTRAWDMGTERTKAYNEALSAIGYWAIRTNPLGELGISPYVLPSSRSPLVSWQAGQGSLMLREWERSTNLSGIPNTIIVWHQQPGEDGEDGPLIIGQAVNANPNDPLSIQNRGEVAEYVQDDVEDQAAADTLARQTLDARSVPSANINLTHALIPDFWGDEVIEATTSGGHHILGSVNEAVIPLKAGGLVKTKLREVKSYG